MNVRVKLSESSETEKKLQHVCCSNVKVWLNEGVAQSSYAPPTHSNGATWALWWKMNVLSFCYHDHNSLYLKFCFCINFCKSQNRI